MSYLASLCATLMLLHLELTMFAAWNGTHDLVAGNWFPYCAVQAWVGLHFLLFPSQKESR